MRAPRLCSRCPLPETKKMRAESDTRRAEFPCCPPVQIGVSTGIRDYLSSRLSDAEMMQYRWCVGPGPSSNTCPRCASHLAQSTSVRRMKSVRSDSVRTFSSATGSEKLGQPVPESNFASKSNSGVPQHTHLKVPD